MLKNNIWKKCFGILVGTILVFFYASTSCHDYPMDDDGLLITTRASCYVSNFELFDVAFQSVAIGVADPDRNPHVDTTACTISVIVRYGTDVKNLYPRFILYTDCILEPKVDGLTDFTSPKQWTVVSGNRKVRKTYTVSVTVQQP